MEQLAMQGIMFAWLLFVLAGCGTPEMSKAASDESIEITSDIVMQPPLELVQLLRWRDGGSIGFQFEDVRGTKLSFTVDGHIGSPTPGRWDLGALYPTTNGTALLLESGGSSERALQRLLDRWLQERFSPAERSQLKTQYWVIRPDEDRLKSDAALIITLLERANKREP
ncbi:MAG: hypothetical protein WC058_01150 [Phycisphaeraceae bacterium]